MNFVATKKLKYFGSISLFSLLILTSAMVAFYLNERSAVRLTYVVTKQDQLEYLTLQVQYSLKRQVQEWKNILLRGYNNPDYIAYYDAFLTHYKTSQNKANQILTLLDKNSPAHKVTAKFIEDNSSLLAKYNEALILFNESNYNAIEADKLVRGIDRAPDRLLEELSETITSEANYLRSMEEDRHNFFKIQLGIMFGCLQMFFCYVLIKLTGKLLSRSLSDDVTSLGNRQLFLHSIRDKMFSKGDFSVCILDLDEFKLINESFGAKGGNRYLKQLATRLSSCIKQNDILTRISADEFGIILTNDNVNKIRETLLSLSKTVSTFQFSWQSITTSLSCCISYRVIKLSEIEDKEKMVSELLNSLYITLQHAKETGRGSIMEYRSTDQKLSWRQLQMRAASLIPISIEEKSIQLYRQKIIPFQKNDNEVYFEVLIRIKENDGNIVSPGLFLQSAERFHLITKIDRYVLNHSVLYLNQNGSSKDRLSINLSGQTLSDPEFISFCEKLFSDATFELSRLGFEITETDFIKSFEEANKTLTFLRNRGCKISLDDFGTGMSSFGYIAELDINTIKIDGTFVKDIHENKNNQAIVRSIVFLCKQLQLDTVAECVEKQEEHDVLEELGVTFVQGYLKHKPELFYQPL